MRWPKTGRSSSNSITRKQPSPPRAGFFTPIRMYTRKSKVCDQTGMTLWKCTGCNQWLDAGYFSKDKRAKSGLNNQCIECQKWRMKKRNYGVTREHYMAMLARQGGVCAICGAKPSSCTHGHLVVDHDHKTGAVRGLLCDHCNKGLGGARDKTAHLSRMIHYLRHGAGKFKQVTTNNKQHPGQIGLF